MKSQKRNIILYLTSQIVSLMGTSLVQCVTFWYITLETQSGTIMTIAMIAGVLPTFLVSPFAGVWADRLDRKTIIMLSDVIGLWLEFVFTGAAMLLLTLRFALDKKMRDAGVRLIT